VAAEEVVEVEEGVDLDWVLSPRGRLASTTLLLAAELAHACLHNGLRCCRMQECCEAWENSETATEAVKRGERNGW